MLRKIRFYYILVFISLSLSTYLISYQASAESVRVIFSDVNMNEAVKTCLNTSSDIILLDEVLNVKEFNATNKNISKVNGIEFMINLQSLNLSSNKLDNIDPIIQLIHSKHYKNSLKSINLSQNQLDLSTGSDTFKKITELKNLGIEIKYLPQNTKFSPDPVIPQPDIKNNTYPLEHAITTTTPPAFKYGTVNNDLLINSSDLLSVRRIINGNTPSTLSPNWRYSANVDGQPLITESDYSLIKKKILKQITKFPTEQIARIDDMTVYLVRNQTYTFPAKVKVVMGDQTRTYYDVSWDSTSLNTSAIGTIVKYGTVAGYSTKVKLTINITNPVTVSYYWELYTALEKGYTQINITDSKIKQVFEKAKTIISSVTTPYMTDFEKELALHDYIVKNTHYDYDNYLNNTIPDDSYCPYGILILGTGVCDGYAQSMKMLLNMVGIECQKVVGYGGRSMSDYYAPYTGSNHAWNVLKLDDKYYQLDATWDDPVGGAEDKIYYTYFNVPDKLMTMHNWNHTAYPECNDFRYKQNYYQYCMDNKIPTNDIRTISGTISVPDGYQLTEDIYAYVYLELRNPTNEYSPYYQEDIFLKIDKTTGKSSYTFMVPPNNSDGYIVKYYLSYEPQNSGDLFRYGFYHETNAGNYTSDKTAATQLNVSNQNKTGINISIPRAYVLAGTISLPNGAVAPSGGLSLTYSAMRRQDGVIKESFFEQCVIEANKNSVSYRFLLPPVEANYVVNFYNYGENEYYETGFYNSSGTTHSLETSEQVFVDKQGKTGINMILLKCKTISGTVKLQGTDTAPAGNIPIYLMAALKKDSNVRELITVNISEGSNSATYIFKLPDVPLYDYFILSYYNYYLPSYTEYGYYNVNGCTINSSMASSIDVTSGQATNINFELLKK